MSKTKKSSEIKEIHNAYDTIELEKLKKSYEKKRKKREKRENKKIEKIRSKVNKNFPLKNEIPNTLVNAIRINKTLIERDKKRNEIALEDYYNRLFNEFKELVIKHNKGLQFEADKLSETIIEYKRLIKEYENKLEKFKEIEKLLKNA
jgi:uncharacterized protein (DUF488 family)